MVAMARRTAGEVSASPDTAARSAPLLEVVEVALPQSGVSRPGVRKMVDAVASASESAT